MSNFKIFKRKAWQKNSDYPNGFEPYGSARKTTVQQVATESEARAICQAHNKNRPESGKGHYNWVFYEYDINL